MRQVIDASVVVAYPKGGPGAEALTSDDGPFCLSSVNLAEVLTKAIDLRLQIDDVMRALRPLSIEHHDHTRGDALRTAALRRITGSHGLSPGDRACLAPAERLALPAVTAARAWAQVGVGIEVRLIR